MAILGTILSTEDVVTAAELLPNNQVQIRSGSVAVFRESTCVAATAQRTPATNQLSTVKLSRVLVAQGTDPVTYTVRFGPASAVTAYANGSNVDYFGGLLISTLIVTEFIP